MARPRRTHDGVHVRRHPLGYALLGSVRNGVSVLVWTAGEDVLQNHLGPADSIGPWAISRSAQNLKLTWQATRTFTSAHPDLCPHWIGQREGLARSQCGERSKLPRGILNMFPSETGELNWSRLVTESIGICQMLSTSKFLSRSQMIIPFSGNYHVPDSID